MKMKKMLLAGVLVLTVSAPAVYADKDTGEGKDIGAIIEILKEQLNQADGKVASALDRLDIMIKEEAGSLSTDELKDYLKRFLGWSGDEKSKAGKSESGKAGEEESTAEASEEEASKAGEAGEEESAAEVSEEEASKAEEAAEEEYEDEEELDLASLLYRFDIIDSYTAAEEEYIREHNAELLEKGDVEIISNGPVEVAEYGPEAPEITNMCVMIQGNYKQNDQNELLLVSEAEDVILFRHERDEEGNYPVVEATFAKNDDTYLDTVEKMCGEVGITLEDGLQYIEISEVMYAYDLEEYLNNHPDIKGIEYQGKVMTAEELEEAWSTGFDAVYAEEGEETETVEAEETEAASESYADVKGIYEALTAEDSDYSKSMAENEAYYPDMVYEVIMTKNGDGFVFAIRGSEYIDGTWTFEQVGDDLKTVFADENYYGSVLAGYVVKAVADYYDMDPSLVSGYINGLTELGIENDVFNVTDDEQTGNTEIRINIAGPYDMKELDEMVIDESVLGFYEPLGEDYGSYASSIGKLTMVASGNKDDFTILLGEYGGLDDLALQSLRSIVGVFQPEGWEDFAAGYTKLEDAEAAGYSVVLDAGKEEVSSLVDEVNDSYQYAIVHFVKE